MLRVVSAQNFVFDIGNAAQGIYYFVVCNIVIYGVTGKVAPFGVLGNVGGKHHRYGRMSAPFGIFFHAKRSILELVVVILDDYSAQTIIDYFRSVPLAKSQRIRDRRSRYIDVGFPKTRKLISDKAAHNIYRTLSHTA